MKILHITDSHGTAKTPESRKDLYYITFLRKLAELAYIVKANKIDMVLHTGDLFHTSRVSNKFMGQVAEIIKAYGVPLYVIPGNHDIDGYSIDTIDQTSVGLLAKTGVINLLTRDAPLKLSANENGIKYTVAISGQEYYADIDTGNMEDFEMQQDEADINILGIHGYITDTPQHPDIRYTMIKDIVTDADIVLSGHYHTRFEEELADVSFYNPGSMLRVDMTEYNKTNIPCYGILTISSDAGGIVYDYAFHKFRVALPGTSVFDYNSKAQVKGTAITLENFKTSIANTILTVSPSVSFVSIIEDLCNNLNDPNFSASSLKSNVLNFYNDAVNDSTNELDSNIGYIPSQQPKFIKSVEIHNYQSHTDSLVEFEDGLNIIVGESNNGKTTIFRAIKWATDNMPLGNDFITTGQTECWVKVNYSDGSYIKRYRTIKDSGYYEVYYKDDISGQWTTETYQGFTNNVPIEIANVHQMPKIKITKDIETHLNMMDQLEGPFLVTQSQAQKAAAIGRITGTHYIDDAIKKVNQDNLALNKINKTLEADIKKTEQDLQLYPSLNDLKKFSSCLSSISKRGDSVSKLLQEEMKIKNEYELVISTSNLIKVRIIDTKKLLTAKDQIAKAEALLDKINLLISIRDQYNNTVKAIESCNSKINQYKEVLLHKDKIERATNVAELLSKLTPIQKGIDNTNVTIKTLSDTLVFGSKFNLLKKNIIRYAILANNSLESLTKIKKDYEQTKLSSMEYSQDVEKHKTKKQINEDILEDVKEEMTSYILSQGKCPCCNQEITEAHVADIISNVGN